MRDFASSFAGARQARRFVSQCLKDWGLADEGRSVELAAGHLIANAVRNGSQAFQIRAIHAGNGSIRVEVRNDGAGPVLCSSRDHGQSGPGRWGLHIVAALGDMWGATIGGGQTVVWFEHQVNTLRAAIGQPPNAIGQPPDAGTGA